MSKKRIAFDCCVEYDNKIWFPAFNHNGLYYIENGCEEAHLVGIIPNEKLYSFRLYSAIRIIKNYIVLIPFFAKEIAVYNINSGLFYKLSLPIETKFNSSLSVDKPKFLCNLEWNECIYMFPHDYPAVVCLDINKMKLSFSDDIVKLIEKKKRSNECYISDLFIKENYAYFSCGCANAFLKLNMVDWKWDFIEIKYNGIGFNGIYVLNDRVWLAPRLQGSIISVGSDNNIHEYSNYPDGFSANAVPFHSFYEYNNKLLLIPALANQFVMIDINTGEMSTLQLATDIISRSHLPECYSYDVTMFNIVRDNELLFISGLDYTFYSIKNTNISSKQMWIESDYPDSNKIISGAFNNSDDVTVAEVKTLGIQILFSYIGNTNNEEHTTKETIVGNTVHEQIKQSILS